MNCQGYCLAVKMVVEVACYYFPLAKIMDANKDTLVAFSSHFTLTPLEQVRPAYSMLRDLCSWPRFKPYSTTVHQTGNTFQNGNIIQFHFHLFSQNIPQVRLLRLLQLLSKEVFNLFVSSNASHYLICSTTTTTTTIAIDITIQTPI